MGGIMGQDDFAAEMRKLLEQQKASAELATRNKLHDGEVLQTGAPKKWEELKEAVQHRVKEINTELSESLLDYSPSQLKQFVLTNKTNKATLTMKFDGTAF